MKKILLVVIFFVLVGTPLSYFIWANTNVEIQDFYVDVDGWPEFFEYNPKTKVLKSEEKRFKVLNKTKNSFSIKNNNELIVYHRLHYAEDEYEPMTKSKVLGKSLKKVAIITFATGDDKDYWNNFYELTEKNFLPRHEKQYFVFTDYNDLPVADNVFKIEQKERGEFDRKVKKFQIISEIKDILSPFDYVYFLDIRLETKQVLNEEVFPSEQQAFVTLLHPCFYHWDRSLFPYERNGRSKAYVPHHEGEFYVSNLFYGGTKSGFISLTETLKDWIAIDTKKFAISRSMDEGYLNGYLFSQTKKFQDPFILMTESFYPNLLCEDQKTEKLDPNKLYVYIDGIKKFYQFDPKTKVLKGETDDIQVSRKTGNTFLVEEDNKSTVYHRVYYTKREYEPLTRSLMLNENQKKIAVISFVTKKEADNMRDFYSSMEKNFLPRHKKTYFFITDGSKIPVASKNVITKKYPQKRNLNRNKFQLLEKLKNELKAFDYIYFIDSNMIAVDTVNEKILPTKEQEVSFALHPWYYRRMIEDFPYERNEKSAAFIEPGVGKFYVENSFWGGTKTGVFDLIRQVNEWIAQDTKQKIVSEWDDESYLNKYLLVRSEKFSEPLILTPEYVYPDIECGYGKEFEPYQKMVLKTEVKKKK